jgi:hypothetical protein
MRSETSFNGMYREKNHAPVFAVPFLLEDRARR